MTRPHRPALTFLVAAAFLVATACSSAEPAGPAQVTFAPDAGTVTPGMAPMSGMAPMPGMGSASSAAPAGPAAPVGPDSVQIQNFAFVPATLTVKAGSAVTWTNRDQEPHTVAASGGQFHSPGMDSNASYTFTFDTPGSYDYVCSIHPFMHGTVVVTP